MIQNYLKIAYRHLWKKKGYAFINILGLAIGLACCLMILLFVQDELNYDSFHKKGDRIYRMSLTRKYPGRERKYAIIPAGFADILPKELPEVEAVCRLGYWGAPHLFKKNGEIYEEEFFVRADTTFFDLFDITLLKGDEQSALSQPNSIVLTETTAQKYFGHNNPIGKIMDIPDNDEDLIVTGVCSDVPENSHLRFNYLLSSRAINFWKEPNYLSFSAYTYLLLKPNTDAKAIAEKLDDLVIKYASGPVLSQFGVNYQEYQAQGNGYQYFLQPLREIYLTAGLENELKPSGSKKRIYFFLVIAILILLIACINFMNLATARSAERAREVGIRKTLGSERKDIAWQFIMEAMVISLISTLLAVALLAILIPSFNELSGKTFSIYQIFQLPTMAALVGIAIMVGLLAGSYPAVVLSSFKPLEVLRGKFTNTKQGYLLRNTLVGFQFFISIGLIIGTIIVQRQLNFMQQTDLGFQKEHVISIKGGQRMTAQQSATIKQNIENLAGVRQVGGCSVMPGDYYWGISMKPKGAMEMTTGSGITIDEGYVDCMGFELIAGRSFSENFTDTLSVLVNEAAIKEMNLSDPIGKSLYTNDDWLNPDPAHPNIYKIVGVVKDFHFQSLHQKIAPLFFLHHYRNFNAEVDPTIAVRLAPPYFQNTIQSIEKTWNSIVPNIPFNYTFLDKDWGQLYAKEEVQRKIFMRFSLLAIFISCMGLLGLATFITQQRQKEIGIRKVMGASIPSLIGLLSQDFMKLVIFAFLIAIPLTWYAGNQWLTEFAYSINISWWMFVIAGLLAVGIAFLTVLYQTLKAALMNPVETLKDD